MSRDGERFSLEAYGRLVAILVEKGYRIVEYRAADPAERHLILRHDVDMDLDAALTMAEFEARKDYAATYFVLVRSELYNPASGRGSRALRRLRELGHAIGLHFDAALYEDNLEDLIAGAEHERMLLQAITGQSVQAFSLHRPSPVLLEREIVVPGLTNAYAPRYLTKFAYVSDSRGGWHRGHPLDNAAVREGRGLHLLTHPIWWTTGKGPAQTRIERFLARRYRFLEAELATHCTAYSAPDRKEET